MLLLNGLRLRNIRAGEEVTLCLLISATGYLLGLVTRLVMCREFCKFCFDVIFVLLSVTGYFGLLTTQVMCEEFSQCYDDVNICLWTNGSVVLLPAAQSACKQRNASLVRITNSNIQSRLGQFRSGAGNLLHGHGFWIDVKAVAVNDFHWLDGSSLAR